MANAIITGSNRGIGLATLKKFAEQGINVWACMRTRNMDLENELEQYSKKFRVWIRPVYFDMADEGQIKEGVHTIISQKETVDILVNNAGMPFGGLMLMTPMDKLRDVFQVNFFSQILMMQLVAKKMIRQKNGVIINLASAGGIEANPGYLAYGSSKSAIIWATKSVARELAEFGIRVNAVAPGLTDTGMGHFKSEDELQKTLARTPLGRMARPEEIADAIYFLASSSASYITGHILQVDGGRT